MQGARLGCISTVMLAAVGLALGYYFLIRFDGVHTVYSSKNCGNIGIALQFKLQRHWLDFERGDEVGYDLTVITAKPDSRPIYTLKLPGRYHHWRGQAAIDFDPLPPDDIGLPTRLFEAPNQTYSRDAWPPESPPLMNIFLRPEQFSRNEFEATADCLQKNRAPLNEALAGLASRVPSRETGFYFPLRLGGIVYGLPPYDDSRYRAAIRAVWGVPSPPPDEIPLPLSGLVTVLPGQRAEGTIDGVHVTILVDARGEYRVQMNPPGTPHGASGPTLFVPMYRHNDGAVTYDISPPDSTGTRHLP